jgi:hypothetical protein
MTTHYLSAPGIEPGTSGSAARTSYHQTTEAVLLDVNITIIFGEEMK